MDSPFFPLANERPNMSNDNNTSGVRSSKTTGLKAREQLKKIHERAAPHVIVVLAKIVEHVPRGYEARLPRWPQGRKRSGQRRALRHRCRRGLHLWHRRGHCRGGCRCQSATSSVGRVRSSTVIRHITSAGPRFGPRRARPLNRRSSASTANRSRLDAVAFPITTTQRQRPTTGRASAFPVGGVSNSFPAPQPEGRFP